MRKISLILILLFTIAAPAWGGSNFHTPWADGTTTWSAASLGVVPSSLDTAITHIKNVIVHTDGNITYDVSGKLSWSDTINILFTKADGNANKNTISAGNITLSDNEFAYVTLSETNNAALTVSKAAVPSAGSASNFKTDLLLVLGYRNTTSDNFFPVALKMPFRHAEIEQTVTDAANVTIDWSLGEQAIITLNQATTAITLSNGRPGRKYRLRLTQDGTGGRAVTWSTSITWAGGSEPSWTTTLNKSDWVELIYSGTTWYGSGSLNY